MNYLREDGEGTAVSGGVTQVGNVDAGKIDIFGTKPKNADDVYNKLFELDDYKNNSEPIKQFSGNVSSLLSSLQNMINDKKFFSTRDITIYKRLFDTIATRFKSSDNITVKVSDEELVILLRLDI